MRIRGRRWAWPVLALATLACGGGSDSGAVATTVAAFASSGTPAAADGVRLTGSVAGDQVTVRVVLGGPTTSSDLSAFAFDLVLGDGSLVEYVVGSAAAGPALSAPTPGDVQALVSRSGNRFTVGVAKLGALPGNGVAAGEAVVVSLRLRVLRTGSTTIVLAGSPPSAPAAIDSAGDVVGTIAFDAAPASISGT